MALTFTSRGSGARNTGSESSYTITPTSSSAAGSMVVICLAYDNSASTPSAGQDPFIGAIDTAGNYWLTAVSNVNDPGVASAGMTGRIIYCRTTTAFTTSQTITIYFNAVTVARAYTIYEVTAAAGSEVTYVTGAATPQTSGTPSITTGSITNADGVVGMVAREANGTRTADADATNGTWSNAQNNGVGSTTSGAEIISETKVVSATATQTYNPTFAAASADGVNAWAQFREAAITYPRTLTFATPMVLNSGFGGVLSSDAVYATALAGASLSTNGAFTAFGVGQQASGINIRQGTIWFDTSIIPVGSVITAVVMSIGGGGASAAAFTLKIAVYDFGAATDTTDYRAGSVLPLSPVVATYTAVTTFASVPSYNTMTDVALASSINPGGLTKYFMWSDKMEGSGTAPAGDDFVWIAGTTGGTSPPKIAVTYTLGDPERRRPFVNQYQQLLAA